MENQKFATYSHWAHSFESFKDYGMIAPWNSGYRFNDFYKVFDADKRLIGNNIKDLRKKHQQLFNEYAEFLVPCVEEILPEFDELLIQKNTNQKIVFEDFGYNYNKETQESCLITFNASIITRLHPEQVNISRSYEQRKKIFNAVASNFPIKQFCIWTFSGNTFYNPGTNRFIKHDYCKASFLKKRISDEIIKECITGRYVRPWDYFFKSYRICFNVCIPKFVIEKGSSCHYLIAGT